MVRYHGDAKREHNIFVYPSDHPVIVAAHVNSWDCADTVAAKTAKCPTMVLVHGPAAGTTSGSPHDYATWRCPGHRG
jgi:hypothetical protein